MYVHVHVVISGCLTEVFCNADPEVPVPKDKSCVIYSCPSFPEMYSKIRNTTSKQTAMGTMKTSHHFDV
jgi:hypothetical protein